MLFEKVIGHQKRLDLPVPSLSESELASSMMFIGVPPGRVVLPKAMQISEDHRPELLRSALKAVHRGPPHKTQPGEDVAKLEGGVRGKPGVSHFELVRICTLVLARSALISPILRAVG